MLKLTIAVSILFFAKALTQQQKSSADSEVTTVIIDTTVADSGDAPGPPEPLPRQEALFQGLLSFMRKKETPPSTFRRRFRRPGFDRLPNRRSFEERSRADPAYFRPSYPVDNGNFRPMTPPSNRRRIDERQYPFLDEPTYAYKFREQRHRQYPSDSRRPFRYRNFVPDSVPLVTYDERMEHFKGSLAAALKSLWDYKRNAYHSLLARNELYGPNLAIAEDIQIMTESGASPTVFTHSYTTGPHFGKPYYEDTEVDWNQRRYPDNVFRNRQYFHGDSRRRPRSIQLVRQRTNDIHINYDYQNLKEEDRGDNLYYDVTFPIDTEDYYYEDEIREAEENDAYYVYDYEVINDDVIEYIYLDELTELMENGNIEILNPDDIKDAIEDDVLYNRQGIRIPGSVAPAPKKTLRVRIKDNSKGGGRKIIKMRIKGLSNPSEVVNRIKGKLKIFRLKNFGKNKGGKKPSSGGYGSPPVRTTPRGGYGVPSRKTTPVPGYTYTVPDVPFSYGPPAGGGYTSKPPTGGKKKLPFLDKLKNFNFQGFKGGAGMNDVLKSTFTQASNALPDLSKAITVMSFLAFSVFVANLGLNAVTNSSLAISFGRENEDEGFLKSYKFDIDEMVTDLDELFQTNGKSSNSLNIMESITDIAKILHSSFEKTARSELEKLTNNIDAKISNEKQSLSSTEVSKRFLMDEEVDPICYRRLLCTSNQSSKARHDRDRRRKILPFWTFGIGWLKGGQSYVPTLLENLRAELAGLSDRNCMDLYPNCPI